VCVARENQVSVIVSALKRLIASSQFADIAVLEFCFGGHWATILKVYNSERPVGQQAMAWGAKPKPSPQDDSFVADDELL
jgi:hypothetical protein